ncbi:hypothetical protein GGS20DRAFT_552539 [Poronia punctata]|nr:hypothetical protein GGS20DRAFT_552539 [Poronia punctata]
MYINPNPTPATTSSSSFLPTNPDIWQARYEMTDGAYKYTQQNLLAELRSNQAHAHTQDCEACTILNKVTCPHLTNAQCNTLKATKRPTGGDLLFLYDCRHVYRGLMRISRDIRGNKVRVRGSCIECWRYLVTDGRRMRVDHVGMRRPRTKKNNNKKNGDAVDDDDDDDIPTARRRRPQGKVRFWRLGGRQVGEEVRLEL